MSAASEPGADVRAVLPAPLLRPLFNPGPGQCTPPAQLNMSLSLPPGIVSLGNVNGDVYTVTVTNNGTVSTTEVSLQVDPSVGFYYVAGTATAASSFSGTLPIAGPAANTTPDATFTLTVTGNALQQALQPGETMTFTFRLATDANALSGQLLQVGLASGSPAPLVCKTVFDNVPTGRGNVTVVKSPALQTAGFGETVTWNVTLRNTGLGTLYNAVVTDSIGGGFAGLSIQPPMTPITLTPNAAQVYTVTATIASCTNLTNTVKAWWSIGNSDGTGTPANPVDNEVDVVFRLEEPVVGVQVGPLPDVNYCGALNTTVIVTVTNTGGAARNLRLNLSCTGRQCQRTELELDPERQRIHLYGWRPNWDPERRPDDHLPHSGDQRQPLRHNPGKHQLHPSRPGRLSPPGGRPTRLAANPRRWRLSHPPSM